MFQGDPRIVLIGHCLAMLLRQVFPAPCLFPLHKQSLRTITDQRNLESPQASFHRTSKLRNVDRRRSSIVSPAEPSQQSPIALLQLVVDSLSATLPPQSTPSCSEGKVFGENTCLPHRHFSGSWSSNSNRPGGTLGTVAMFTTLPSFTPALTPNFFWRAASTSVSGSDFC